MRRKSRQDVFTCVAVGSRGMSCGAFRVEEAIFFLILSFLLLVPSCSLLFSFACLCGMFGSGGGKVCCVSFVMDGWIGR